MTEKFDYNLCLNHMQGDWYMLEGEGPRRVRSISIYSDVSGRWPIVDSFENMNCYQWPADIKPIPLTDEILEKNDFKHSCVLGLNEWRFECGNSGISLYTSKSEKSVGGFHLTLCVDDKDIPAMSFTLDMCIIYVHQLQHALRLANVNKEITI